MGLPPRGRECGVGALVGRSVQARGALLAAPWQWGVGQGRENTVPECLTDRQTGPWPGLGVDGGWTMISSGRIPVIHFPLEARGGACGPKRDRKTHPKHWPCWPGGCWMEPRHAILCHPRVKTWEGKRLRMPQGGDPGSGGWCLQGWR